MHKIANLGEAQELVLRFTKTIHQKKQTKNFDGRKRFVQKGCQSGGSRRDSNKARRVRQSTSRVSDSRVKESQFIKKAAGTGVLLGASVFRQAKHSYFFGQEKVVLFRQ
jgi:hypothetical protein